MFLIDDILLSPAKGLLWLCREIQAAAERARAEDREGLMRALQSLHMRLEAGAIDEAEFDRQEREILDRLDAMDGGEPDEEPDDDDDEDDEDDEESDGEAKEAA